MQPEMDVCQYRARRISRKHVNGAKSADSLAEVNVRRGLLTGSLLVGVNALIGLAAFIAVGRLILEEPSPSAETAAPPPPAQQGAMQIAEAAPAEKTQDRIGPSDPPAGRLRLWPRKAEQTVTTEQPVKVEQPPRNVAPEISKGGLWSYGDAKLRTRCAWPLPALHLRRARQGPRRPIWRSGVRWRKGRPCLLRHGLRLCGRVPAASLPGQGRH